MERQAAYFLESVNIIEQFEVMIYIEIIRTRAFLIVRYINQIIDVKIFLQRIGIG